MLIIIQFMTVIFNILPVSYAQMIISPSPDKLLNLCRGEEVSITCETRGSSFLAWTSYEYIGLGGIWLVFYNTINYVGDTLHSPVNLNTSATLVNKTVENGVPVLVSTLHIRALSGFLNSSVICLNDTDGGANTRIQVVN